MGALQERGVLAALAKTMDQTFSSKPFIIYIIGLLSAVMDNVPLVAAGMGMWDMSAFPMDNSLWEMLAYCAGTGGSILIIGSVAGVVVMGDGENRFSLVHQTGLFVCSGRIHCWIPECISSLILAEGTNKCPEPEL